MSTMSFMELDEQINRLLFIRVLFGGGGGDDDDPGDYYQYSNEMAPENHQN